MLELIKNDRIVTDEWKTLTLRADDTAQSVRLPVGPLLVPLSVWQARREELIHREYEHGWLLGIWLAAEEDAKSIAQDIDDFTVIAIKFTKPDDSRGIETARELRERYGYSGELRAIGNVPNDNLSLPSNAGFDVPKEKTYGQIAPILANRASLPANTRHYGVSAA